MHKAWPNCYNSNQDLQYRKLGHLNQFTEFYETKFKVTVHNRQPLKTYLGKIKFQDTRLGKVIGGQEDKDIRDFSPTTNLTEVMMSAHSSV